MSADIRALLARWERGITALYEAAEQERDPAAQDRRYIEAGVYERCVLDLRAALRGPGPGGM